MLDIIIPTYNNKKGLLQTLNSIPPSSEITITIIDDCSTEQIDYSDIKNKYNFLINERNMGPGETRQKGIYQTYEPYIMFIDTEDYLLSGVLEEIIKTIKKNPNIDIFSWQHKGEQKDKIYTNTHNRMHGRVYKRKFLMTYNITFPPDSSYANEDIGFNRICRLIVEEGKGTQLFIPKLIYMWTYNPNSLTQQDNGAFTYKKQNIALMRNGIHIYNTCKNLISVDAMEEECGYLLGAMYRNVYQCAQEHPEYLQYSWEGAYDFYHKLYKPNNYDMNHGLQCVLGRLLKERNKKKEIWTKPITINLNRFLADLDKYEQPPSWYMVG